MLSKERMREYMGERRQAWRAAGLCVDCGAQRDDLRYQRCSKCRALARKRVNAWNARRRNDG